jgi:hypothetical protein
MVSDTGFEPVNSAGVKGTKRRKAQNTRDDLCYEQFFRLI